MAELFSKIDLDATLDCVHCGLCLPHCPTYQETGRESSSPRGRIYMMRGVAEGRLELDRSVVDEMFLCLACRACESACPAGVRYGHLVETARAEIAVRGPGGRMRRAIERLTLRRIVASRSGLRRVADGLRAYQRSGIQRLVRRSGVLRLIPPLARAESGLPWVPDAHVPPVIVPAVGIRRGRVGMFRGCIMPELFGPVNAATIRVLALNGFEVEIPPDQACCGALHLHAGDPEAADRLRERNRSAFRLDSLDAVVVNSAGCGATMKDYADEVAEKTRDVSEFLVDAGFRAPERRLALRVAYDDPCHLLHGQRIERAPRELLGSIPGLELIDLPGHRDCCGAAGTYSLTQPEMSQRLLARKVEAIREVDPDVVATANPGCLMQIGLGAERAALGIEVLHPVELLARAYDG